MTDSKRGPTLQAIQTQLQAHGDRMASLEAKIDKIDAEATSQKVDTARITAELQAIGKDLSQLVSKINNGDGLVAAMVTLRAHHEDTAKDLLECQRRCSAKWRAVWAIFAAVVAPVVVWLIVSAVNHIGGDG